MRWQGGCGSARECCTLLRAWMHSHEGASLLLTAVCVVVLLFHEGL